MRNTIMIAALTFMASSVMAQAPTVDDILRGAETMATTNNGASAPAVNSKEYMPAGCISQNNGCCLITTKEYEAMLLDVAKAGAVSAKHEARCENGTRNVTSQMIFSEDANKSVGF